MLSSIGNVGNSEMREHEIWDVEGHDDFLECSWGKADEGRGRHWELLKSVAELVRFDRVLDAGCGMGHFFHVLMKERNSADYTGFDNSEKMLEKAWKTFPDNNERFKQGDIYDLSSFPIYDTVVCISVLIHLPEIEKPIRELWSITGKETIITARIDEKGFYTARGYSGKTVLPNGKKLVLRGEPKSNIFSIFGKLDDVGAIEIFDYDARSTIFKLTRGIPKYGSFRNGWQRRVL